MPKKGIEIEHCTSCGSTNIKVEGNQYYCPDCDKTAKVTEQGTKVIDKNPLGKEKARIDRIEKDVAELKGEKEPGAESTEPDDQKYIEDHPEPTAMDEEEPDGFVNW